MEYTEEQRALALQHQQASTYHGTIVREKGCLTQDEISGMIYAVSGPSGGFIVFGDPLSLMIEQNRTFIPEHRVFEVRYDA